MAISGRTRACEDKLVGALRVLADGEQDPVRKAKEVFTMAQAVEKEINDPYRAATLYEEALSLDGTRFDAFPSASCASSRRAATGRRSSAPTA